MKNTVLAQHPTAFALQARLQRRRARLADRLGRRRFNPRRYAIEEVAVSIAGLDSVFDGLRIAHITDIHLGQWVSSQRLEGIVGLVNELQPDIIAMTGDFVSYLLDDVADDLAKALSKLHAPDGVFAVLGNHDHWTDPVRVRELLATGGARMLDNDVVRLSRGDAALQVAGVDSVMVGEDRIEDVLERLDGQSPAILLAHEPDFADISAATGRFALQLSGHSHGTQILLPKVGPLVSGPYFRNYPIGRYEVEGMTLYTNRGLGTNVIWTRLNCPPEIAVVTLEAK